MEKIGPEKLMSMMKAKGVEMSLEQATAALDFLRKLANIVVVEFMHRDKNGKQKE